MSKPEQRKPEQQPLFQLTHGSKPKLDLAHDLPRARYRLIHRTCGWECGYVESLGYPLNDHRAGYADMDGFGPDLRDTIRCPKCFASLSNCSDVQALRANE